MGIVDSTGDAPGEAVPRRVAKGAPPSWRAVAAGVVVAAVLAGGAFVALRPETRSAEEAVAAARAAVAGAGSFRYTQVIERNGDRAVDEGEWLEGRWHVVAHEDGRTTEVVVDIDGTTYLRQVNGNRDEIGAGVDWDAVPLPPLVDVVDALAATAATAEDMRPAGPSGGRDPAGESLTDVLGDAGSLEEAGILERTGRVADPIDAEAIEHRTAVSAALMLLLRSDDADSTVRAPGPLGSGLGPGVDPAALFATLADRGEPEWDGDATVVADVRAPADVQDAFAQAVPEVRVEVELGPDDFPTAVRLHASTGSRATEIELTFTDWDDPLLVAIPSGEGVDHTPWIEEEDLLTTEVVAVVPQGALEDPRLRVQAASAFSRARGAADCDLLDIRTLSPPPQDPRPASDDGLYQLYEVPAACARQRNPAPFEPGGPGGWPARADLTSVELLVGDTVVEVVTHHDATELETLAASLLPISVEALAGATADAPPAGWTPADLIDNRAP